MQLRERDVSTVKIKVNINPSFKRLRLAVIKYKTEASAGIHRRLKEPHVTDLSK